MFQPYNILFYKGSSILGKLIRSISNGKYSHCSLFLDHIHTLETSWKNPSVIKHFNYKYKDYDIYKLNVRLTEYQKQLILQYITEHIKVGYDFPYLLTRALHLLFGTKVINSKKYLTCDELILESFKVAGIHLIEKDIILTPSTLSESKYLTKIN